MITGRKVRIAIVGAGNMATNVHYPSLTSFDDVEIVAVIETREERLNLVRDRFGIGQDARRLVRLDTDYQAVLNDVKPDGVYVIAVTPFTETGALDLDSTDRMVDFYL